MTMVLLWTLGLTGLFTWTEATCVPDAPAELLSNTQILDHPTVVKALNEARELLQKPYHDNVTRDGLSVAVVHASSPIPIFTFNAGALKFNETSSRLPRTTEDVVTSDSIFRVASVTKNFAMASALVLSRLSRHAITLDTPVRNLLPSFHLPDLDWNDGGSEITLRMLASHMSGITRESFSSNFNQILSTGKATADSIGELWAAQTVENVIEEVRKTSLMFKAGERSAYSNAGIGILGAAVASYYNEITREDLTWSDIVEQEILEPLNMTNSFFGPIPDSLIPGISVPGGDNWADLVIGEGYNPAAGMWSSTNDLANYLHSIWLQPSPSLITSFDRRHALKPVYTLPDGKQQVGPGWEISLRSVSTSSNTSVTDSNKTYSIYGKSGSGGGWRSWIDVVPNLGYGLVILSQTAGLEGYEMLYPAALYGDVQDILIPAFAEALAAQVAEKYAGTYGSGRDTGIISDVVSSNSYNTATNAKLEVQDQVLYMRELVVNGSSALEAIDKLSWLDNEGARYFSRPAGVVLEPAGGVSETAEFGDGARVFRMTAAGAELCEWYDYDGYKDQNGWPLTKLVLVDSGNKTELHYPPFDIVVTKL
ncbi:beta-lactamase/transpeptidase-like protein [Didymella exigua CBS 183.55]|uniref:Beta-lactamase/transpeptidase-like protein n=1 Tax=Didymella exigua CBS 183.55 TaxID=1150837 RepID=A0A6A5RHY8_9PLEO|nr:beta-lactamase/transpeptidase-like protein [Didymella exigua CBS 183.55]KAF1927179.1 beta-lactamase/transpeptidase-like protein [Didymella exigua CBS 183.55]